MIRAAHGFVSFDTSRPGLEGLSCFGLWQHQAMAALVAPLHVSSVGTSPVTEGVKGSQAQSVLMQSWCIVYGHSLPVPYLECEL